MPVYDTWNTQVFSGSDRGYLIDVNSLDIRNPPRYDHRLGIGDRKKKRPNRAKINKSRKANIARLKR